LDDFEWLIAPLAGERDFARPALGLGIGAVPLD
jgi:hypothetical protein